MQEITINNNVLTTKEYNGKRVVTFKDIDMVHGRPDGTARKRFNDNKKYFIKNEDYFKVKCSEVSPFFGQTLPNGFNPNADIILLTESGYLMIVKSFTDDLAWRIQRELVNSYFKVKTETYYINNFQEISNLKEEVADLKDKVAKLPKPLRNTYWFSKMYPKYKLLTEYYDISLGKLYYNLLLEMQNKFNIDVQQLIDDYLFETGKSTCYPLEPFENDKKYRDMIEEIVNDDLVKKGIVDEDDILASDKIQTIFNSKFNSD